MTERSTHPPDDDLVLLFYGELPEDAQGRLRLHLADCEDCRASYNALTRTLHLTSGLQAPDPGPDFEARMWARVAPSAQSAARLSSSWWRLGAVAAALLLVAGGVWNWLHRLPDEPTPDVVAVATPTDDGTRERVLLAAVDAHLVQTEMLFVELLNAPASEGSSDYTRVAADDLLASGRLYRETARDTGASQLVAVFDELEPVLVEVARSGNDTNTGDIRALRGRIEQDDLLFKVRAVAADIQDRQDRSSSGEGAL